MGRRRGGTVGAEQDVENVACKTRIGVLRDRLLDKQMGENGQDDEREGARVFQMPELQH